MRIRILAVAACAAVTGCAAFIPNIRPSEDTVLQIRVQRVGARVVAAAHDAMGTDTSEWMFGTITDSGVGGAVSVSDGRIGIEEGLARALDDDGLAFVIGHEVAHLALGHHHPRLAVTLVGIGAVLATGVVAYAALPYWGAVVSGAESLREIGTAVYSRDQEDDADAYGLWLMVCAGYPSAGAIRAFDVLDTYAWHLGLPRTTVFSDHPDNADRRAHLERIRSENGYR